MICRWLDKQFPPHTIHLKEDGEADVIIPEHYLLFYGKNLLAPAFVLVAMQAR